MPTEPTTYEITENKKIEAVPIRVQEDLLSSVFRDLENEGDWLRGSINTKAPYIGQDELDNGIVNSAILIEKRDPQRKCKLVHVEESFIFRGEVLSKEQITYITAINKIYSDFFKHHDLYFWVPALQAHDRFLSKIVITDIYLIPIGFVMPIRPDQFFLDCIAAYEGYSPFSSPIKQPLLATIIEESLEKSSPENNLAATELFHLFEPC